MMNVFFSLLSAIYAACLLVLALYGLNFLWMTLRALFSAGKTPVSGLCPDTGVFPAVTVQLPVYNELFVAERLINAVAQLSYPRERLELQVLDDSTDETSALVAAAVEHWRAHGLNIAHIRRGSRAGFKAGALAHGLASARGEFIALLDADFLPAPDFLQRVMARFAAPDGATLAFVQARWGHLNAAENWLTALQAVGIDGHFAIEQQARSDAGLIFNFNGTAGVWRRAAIDDAGGWKADTLTEDLDLSYRAHMRGWHARYLPCTEVPAELPATFAAFRRQQKRWALGSLQTAIKLLPGVSCARLPFGHKLHAAFHLTAYSIHLWMALVSLLYLPLLLLINHFGAPAQVFEASIVFSILGLSPSLMFLAAQHRLGRNLWRELPRVLLVSVLGMGMMANTLRAAIKLFDRAPHEFERTPKLGRLRMHKSDARYRLGLDGIVVCEIAFALWNVASMMLALQAGYWGIAFYAAQFAVGLFTVSSATLIEWWRDRQLPRVHMLQPTAQVAAGR